MLTDPLVCGKASSGSLDAQNVDRALHLKGRDHVACSSLLKASTQQPGDPTLPSSGLSSGPSRTAWPTPGPKWPDESGPCLATPNGRSQKNPSGPPKPAVQVQTSPAVEATGKCHVRSVKLGRVEHVKPCGRKDAHFAVFVIFRQNQKRHQSQKPGFRAARVARSASPG